jgi:cyclophilin family peptidyl-prolyl cis-trans isomerase
LGWYQNYRAGKGGRHLQGRYWDRDAEELAEINNEVFAMGSELSFIDLKIGDTDVIHRLEMELATAALPLTTRNFQLLCEDGHYQNTIVHRIERNVGICLGDVDNRQGKGGRCHPSLSISGKLPETEPLVISHLPGIVTMTCPGVDKVDSRFLLVSKEAPHLDGLFVGFGRLSGDSLAIVRELEETVHTQRGLPTCGITIVDCGKLEQPSPHFKEATTEKAASAA